MNASEIGKKLDNTKLIEAMEKLRADENRDTLRGFFEQVTGAILIAPAKLDKEPKPDENGRVRFDREENLKVNFSLLTNGDGEKVLPCFTDDATISASQFDKGFSRMILPYKKLVELVKSSNGVISGIAINPFTQNCFVSGEFIKNYEQLLKNENSRVKQHRFQKGDKVKLRTPKYQPVKMLEEAVAYLKTRPEVDRAFLQMFDDGKSDDKYLIVLEMAGDERTVLEELVPLIKPYSFGIDLIFMKSTSFVGWKVTTIAEPFYVREGYVPRKVEKPETGDTYAEDDVIAEDYE